jgi:ribose 5-phosphate isomerase B
METLLVGSDHAGFELKDTLTRALEDAGYTVVDVGCKSGESCDYPVFAGDLCRRIQAGEATRGILICGTGIGMSMAANRFKGIRAALCSSEQDARMSRAHNDSNVLVVGARTTEPADALAILGTWLETPFEGGRHKRRIDLIDGPCA